MKSADKGVEADRQMVHRKENEDELCAQDWLRQQGYSDIRRPCDDPPDFVVDGCAVEVTRLNQRIVVGNDKQSIGEEEARKPLEDRIRKILDQLGPPGNDGCSWVVDCEYDFSKPLPTPRSSLVRFRRRWNHYRSPTMSQPFPAFTPSISITTNMPESPSLWDFHISVWIAVSVSISQSSTISPRSSSCRTSRTAME